LTATPGPHSAAASADAESAVRAVARRQPLLVALDFDGVCAPLVDDPADSRMLPGTRAVVTALHETGVHVALVSGRALASLREVAEPDPGWLLVGGHGAEPGDAAGVTLGDGQAGLLARLTDAVEEIAARHDGVAGEHKPTSVVLHTRRAGAEQARAATEALLAGPASWDGVHVRRGHDVIELAVVEADKGTAVTGLRERTGAASVLYVGDDVTDEDAFLALDPDAGDVGVKVGDGPSAATHRVDSPEAVTALLEALLAARADTSARA
jgi:trehalose 6-phosphate phosphatase